MKKILSLIMLAFIITSCSIKVISSDTISLSSTNNTSNNTSNNISSNETKVNIAINETATFEFEMGSVINYQTLFKITDEQNNQIEVKNEMIDATKVDINQSGTYPVTINYMGKTESVTITIKAKSSLTTASNLFISEYAEGSGNNKYIELFNGTGNRVDLSNYSLALFVNGKMTPTYTFDLSGILKDGQTYVIYHNDAIDEIKTKGNINHAITFFNGNDVVALYQNQVLIDIVGDINNPVASGWNIGDVVEATKDHTLIRKSNIKSPNNSWTPNEWAVLACDDFSNLKVHVMDNYQPIIDDEEIIDEPHQNERFPDLFISEYFEGNGGLKDSKYIEIYNGLTEDVDLSRYSLAIYKNGSKTATYIQKLNGILKTESIYVVYSTYSVDEIKAKGNLASEVCYFNGNAAIALLKDNTVIDVFGVIGEYPSGGWDVDEFTTTTNNTLIRKETVNSPTNIWDVNEWYVCYENYLYGLGNHIFYN